MLPIHHPPKVSSFLSPSIGPPQPPPPPHPTTPTTYPVPYPRFSGPTLLSSFTPTHHQFEILPSFPPTYRSSHPDCERIMTVLNQAQFESTYHKPTVPITPPSPPPFLSTHIHERESATGHPHTPTTLPFTPIRHQSSNPPIPILSPLNALPPFPHNPLPPFPHHISCPPTPTPFPFHTPHLPPYPSSPPRSHQTAYLPRHPTPPLAPLPPPPPPFTPPPPPHQASSSPRRNPRAANLGQEAPGTAALSAPALRSCRRWPFRTRFTVASSGGNRSSAANDAKGVTEDPTATLIPILDISPPRINFVCGKQGVIRPVLWLSPLHGFEAGFNVLDFPDKLIGGTAAVRDAWPFMVGLRSKCGDSTPVELNPSWSPWAPPSPPIPTRLSTIRE
ncbi:hypothetical protein C7M84_006372 [Penaeus vannamei]|uniref:Uncharacterized protein n=1 Tax=Penaeus vannamei TaxID=6689 RepID=A0A423TF77_PENVA|nr:hypothetical protein C7M84_006372 [Penaeus vannamei]